MIINEFVTRLLRALKPYKIRLILGLVFAAIASGLDTLAPILLKFGVDSLRDDHFELLGRTYQSDAGWLFIFAGAILLSAAIAGIFRFNMRMRVIGASRFVEADIRANFFRHLLKLSPSFFDRNRTGDLMARATEDIERVRMVLGPTLQFSTSTILTIIFSGFMMFTLDTVLATWVLALAPLVGASVFAVARKLHIANTRQQEAYSELSNQVQENLSGIRVIKAFVREDHEDSRFQNINRRYFKRSMDVALAQALFMPTLALLIGLGSAGIMWIGGHRILSGETSLGDFIAFMSYLSLMTWPMIALGWMTHLYQRGSASDKRLHKIMNTMPQFEDRKDVFEPDRKQNAVVETAPEIQYENITLRYNHDSPPVLDQLDFTIKAGETVAIVGQVGCGKSSLVRLLPRLYDPDKGTIIINGKSWNDLDVTDLRKTIGYVDQTPFLFSASIRDNICTGRKEATDEEIHQAARISCFDRDMESFPKGYDTMIGERGVTLSGGQQQRLTLARALIINSPILILDDALSAVDSDTEAEILANLRARLEGRTTLFVTHRLAAAEEAERILVLHQGKLVENGSHDELLAMNGFYASMYRRQRIAEELEGL